MRCNASSPAKRILVADDDPVLLDSAYSSLSTAGYRVVRATNGIEAISKLEDFRFDLIIADLEIPQLDGFSLLEAVRGRNETRHVPVIVITGHNRFDWIERAYALGATSFMFKPLNWTQFGHHLRYILRASQQETQLREARDAAEAASRLKSNVLAVVTHEFRTPLHQIIGFSDLLAKQESDESKRQASRQYSGHIREAALNLDQMVSDILIFSRLMASKPALSEQDLSISPLMSSAVQTLAKKAADKGVAITSRVSKSADVDLVCDRAIFQRAVAHLVENAVEHSPSGGSVVVGVDLSRSGELVCFVKDDGPGLEPARVEELLDPLSQGDMSLTRSGTGLGIGLSIARLAAEAHGGQLHLETAPGAGTTVALVFPPERVRYLARSEPQTLAH